MHAWATGSIRGSVYAGGVPGPLLAIDGPFVLYRSFFALPDSITGVDGHPVNALLGAVNLILRIAADRRPRAIVVCFGAEAAAYRVELYPGYHAAAPAGPRRAGSGSSSRRPELFDAFGWSCDVRRMLRPTTCSGSLAAARGRRRRARR